MTGAQVLDLVTGAHAGSSGRSSGGVGLIGRSSGGSSGRSSSGGSSDRSSGAGSSDRS